MIRFETPQFLQRFKDRITAKVATATIIALAGGGMVYRGMTTPAAASRAPKVKVASGTQLVAATGEETEPEQPSTLPPEAAEPSLYKGEGTQGYGDSETPPAEDTYGYAPPRNGLRGSENAEVGPVSGTEEVASETEQPPAGGSAYGAADVAEESPLAESPPAEESGAPRMLPAVDPTQVATEPAADAGGTGGMLTPPAAGSLGGGGLKRRVPNLSGKSAPTIATPTPPSSFPANEKEKDYYEGGTATTDTPEPKQPSSNPYRSGGAASSVAESATVPPSAEPEPAYTPTTPDSGYGGTTGSLGAVAPRTLSNPTSAHAEPPAEMMATSTLGTASTPGDRQLDGAQTPAVTLEKVAPTEIQVGRPATFEVRVRNVGQVPAHHVIVSDQIPRGTQLQGTKPEAVANADGALVWQLGTIPPGQEVSLAMQVIPEQEGEIGSIAQVGFAAQASARAICTRPLLKIVHSAPKQVLIGEVVNMSIEIENPGSGAATGVIIEEDVPDGLTHDGGRELEYNVGTLRPGESRRLDLQMRAAKPGIVQNTIHVRGEGNLAAQHDVQIEVIAPQLNIGIDGPKKRFLDRQATYTLTLANPGTAPARNVEMVAYLPKGVKFVQTDSQGQYDARQHAVFWALEELPQQKKGTVKLTVLPFEAGEQLLRIDGRAELGLTATQDQTVQVEGVTELAYTIADLADPVEVGGENTYEIRVVNNGSRAVTNVTLVAIMPQGINAKEGEGPTKVSVAGQKVVFEPLPRMNPQDEVVFKIHGQAMAEGDYLLKVQLSCDEFPTPVSKEESTRVYTDR